MSAPREPIAVIGTGYVGLVTAAGFAELGSEVFCVDIDEAKIRGLREGRIPIWEPGLEELVARHRDRMHFDTTLDDVLELYAPLEAPLVRTDIRSAEMVKLASNAFLATKISFINEIANVCEETGADVAEVARGMGLDERIGRHFLRPGVGYGGSCFPKDVSALKQLAGNSGYHFQLLNAVIEVNELQKRRVIGKLTKHLGSLVGKRIALLGLAFKPETDDMREASSLVLSARLQADGAIVRAYDPVAEDEARKLMRGVEFADTALEALTGADACIVVTEWPEFGR